MPSEHTGQKLDVSASYPTGEKVLNVSKETTVRELIAIAGADETLKRRNTVNFSAGHVNAVEFCTAIHRLPQLETLLTSFETDMGLPLTFEDERMAA